MKNLGANLLSALFLNMITGVMENKEENKNQRPSRMINMAFPKAKYGAIIAVVIIIVVNLIFYKETILSFLK